MIRRFIDHIRVRGTSVECLLMNEILPGTGVNREFRVVRDNRVNQNVGREIKPPSAPSSLSKHEPVMSNFSENRCAHNPCSYFGVN